MANHTTLCHILSNAQPSLFPDNRANAFTNRIHPPLSLTQGEQWEVGLKEFSIVNTIQSVPKNLTFDSIQTIVSVKKKEPRERKSTHTVPRGFYTPTSLIAALNKDGHGYNFSVNELKAQVYKISVKTESQCRLYLEPMLADILGLGHFINGNQTKEAKLPLNLSSFSYNIIVYCDIVDESSVGGRKEKILRIIPFKEKDYLSVYHQEFIHIDYIPVAAHKVDDIHVKLYSDYGDLLPVEDGRCYMKLHFRRRLSK